jgi:hypothetical protein
MKHLISLGVLAFIVGMLFAPVALIWSLNTLFPALAIPVTLETYLAAMFLTAVVSPTKG